MADELDPWQELGDELYATEDPPGRSRLRIWSAGGCLIFGSVVGVACFYFAFTLAEARWELKLMVLI